MPVDPFVRVNPITGEKVRVNPFTGNVVSDNAIELAKEGYEHTPVNKVFYDNGKDVQSYCDYNVNTHPNLTIGEKLSGNPVIANVVSENAIEHTKQGYEHTPVNKVFYDKTEDAQSYRDYNVNMHPNLIAFRDEQRDKIKFENGLIVSGIVFLVGCFVFFFLKKNRKQKNLNFMFNSSDHLRYENGIHVSGPHGGASRAVKVEPNINGKEGVTVTIFNTDGQYVVQMAPKQMKIVKEDDSKVVLRGYGIDQMGQSFSDYGLTIYIKNEIVQKCILHMHDRNVDIEYLKSVDGGGASLQKVDSEFEELEAFFNNFRVSPMNVKMSILQKTDELNNIGCQFYNNDDFQSAIDYYNKALEIFPINDDALGNLINCYKITNDYKKIKEIQKKLDYLKKLGL